MNHPPASYPQCAVKVESKPEHFQPYAHQQAAWDAMSRYFEVEKKKAGILVVPTGGGKTAIATRWLLRHHVAQGGRVLWLTHRRGLLRQAFDAFAHSAGLASPRDRVRLIAISGEDRALSNVSKDDDVVFATIQSAGIKSRQADLELLTGPSQSPKGLFVVVDEAHHAASPSYQRTLRFLQEAGCPILGLTATPVRMDVKDQQRLWKVFGSIIYQIQKTELIQKGILSTPSVETVQTHAEFDGQLTQADNDHLKKFGDLPESVLESIAKHGPRNHLIVDHYVQHQEKFGKTLVFAVNTSHAKTLAEEFKTRNISVDYVDYTRKDCDVVMDAYRNEAEPQVLVNVEMLTEGFDAPRTQSVFLARPTKSESLLSQMVGRALRGERAGGTKNAYLVTFVDSWKLFHPLDVEYVVEAPIVVDDVETKPSLPFTLTYYSNEAILEAYRLMRSKFKGSFTGVFQCLPHAWYTWEEEFADDIQTISVMVFDNQVEGFAKFDKDFAVARSIPETVSESYARNLVREYFGGEPDPLPRWQDIKALLDARRNMIHIDAFTFKEKAEFDPAMLAKQVREEDLGQRAVDAKIQAIFDGNAVCQLVYHNDAKAFFEDVERELSRLRKPAAKASPTFLALVPTESLRSWPNGDEGYPLGVIWEAVVGQAKHFPNGVPKVRDMSYWDKPKERLYGCFRYSDMSMWINPILNSPDVPRFVVEFLVYHEALHADMPNAGHNADFRSRERRFNPSVEALEDASRRNFVAGAAAGAWAALADQFLDTLHQRFTSVLGKAEMEL